MDSSQLSWQDLSKLKQQEQLCCIPAYLTVNHKDDSPMYTCQLFTGPSNTLVFLSPRYPNSDTS